MNIDKVMIAGIDNNTPITELERLTEQYPFVEWGVLFSKHKMGQKRYPSLDKIQEFCDASIGYMSAHFCGAYPREILEKGEFNEVVKLNSKFDSIQLNYNFSRSKKWDLGNLTDLLKITDSVILQQNKSNESYLKSILYSGQIRYLYDASGGRGTEIKHIQTPKWLNYTGYAGGIKTHNVEAICRKIINNKDNRKVWIDLESGARDEFNNFSIQNAEKILEISSKFIN